jgi:arylsulfatase I/J
MHVADWFPTIAGLAGCGPKADLKWDGIDQWPALTGAPPAGADSAIYIAMQGGQALLQGDWKLIVRNKSKPELYNLADDPYETKDVAVARAAEVRRLEKLLREHRDRDDPMLPRDLEGLPK